MTLRCFHIFTKPLLACAAILLLLCGGCKHNVSGVQRRLAAIETLIDSAQYENAISQLEEIMPDTLNDRDRALHALLLVKARDKAYVKHMSDSLIRSAFEYYSRHKTDTRYPEALYYVGRVASDMGDYPTALKYFQEACDVLKSKSDTVMLKGTVNSQTARLFKQLRIYDKAEEYSLEALRLDIIENDSIGLFFNRDLLAQIYLRQRKLDKADSILKINLDYGRRVMPEYCDREILFMAVSKYHQKKYKEALRLIKTISNPSTLDITRNIVYAYCVRIYHNLGIKDTAALYAKQLIKSKDVYDRKDGYMILLSKDMQGYVPKDSVFTYAQEFNNLVEDYLNTNGEREALMQSAMYNYNKHEEERVKEEIKRLKFQRWLILTILILILFIFSAIYYRHKYVRNLKHLREEIQQFEQLLNNIKNRDNNISSQNSTKESCEKSILPNIISDEIVNEDKESLRERMRKNIEEFYQSCSGPNNVPEEILTSDVYRKLIEQHISIKAPIPIDSPLWDELRKVIHRSSPDFDKNLMLLYGGAMDITDYHISLLVKCGVTPTQLTFLLCKEKGTLSYRRKKLCLRLLDKDLGAKAFADIISAI